MTFIKKLEINGFKSFAQKTEIPFKQGINIVVGPNGSGKSNISDALCFVLGRISSKSMRAQKSKNLIFMGTKNKKPAKEASVELVFDNSTNTFNIQTPEISLKRIVRQKGGSIYKINNEVKTRGEVLELLAQSGIDPHGFNLILQGQIQAIVKMHSEERRKIIEEVAGISIYESRKEKSIKELEKTDTKLKEISTVLKERRLFLKNLEYERSQALKHKELEKTIKRCKASILTKKINEKNKEISSIIKSLEEKSKEKENIKKKIEFIQDKIEKNNDKINQINKQIKKSTGLEQEQVHEIISDTKAEIEGLRVRRENYGNRRIEIKKRIESMKESVPQYEKEINELRKKSPLIAKKQEELKKKKQELEILGEQRKLAYTQKTKINSVKERIKDKSNQITKINVASESIIKQIEENSQNLIFDDLESCSNKIKELSNVLLQKKLSLEKFLESEIKLEKIISSSETQISSAKEIRRKVQEIDICPICQNKMTEEHLKNVIKSSTEKIIKFNEKIIPGKEGIANLRKNKEKTRNEIENKIIKSKNELSNQRIIFEKKEFLKNLIEEENLLKKEFNELEKKKLNLEDKIINLGEIEEKYSSKIREIEEISSRTDKDSETTLLYRERELENIGEVIKRSLLDIGEIHGEIEEINGELEIKADFLGKREEAERRLNEEFKQKLNERENLQSIIQKESYNLSTYQNESRQIEEQSNYLKIGNAKLEAEKEAIDMELKEFSGIEIIKISTTELEKRLSRSQELIQKIGLINMRALEVYGEIKKEYDIVQEKVDTLEKEKIDILRIIEEIDRKKKRTFMKTFKGLNELFTSNFSRLYSKGQAYLEIENKENLFEGGINIAIKMAKGKYFDVTSLSGGEQTLVALSLLFAIQELKPYHFYILDEIDAALDKRNSERLSNLLRKHLQSGQYIIITHNDAIINESNTLYGVSMHEGISKVLSLDLEK
ncbi:TPA: chromosome segregation protein SMC [Candidatus Pacearchaeota archaeon]|nr:chromosome segregation protein SMC [Candidatus Pacearchaeota archaeon]